MDTGQVRSILALHLGRLHPQTLARHDGQDPNALVESWTLGQALQQVQADQGEAALRAAAADYVALWARTFRTLVGQLRGRPERAVSLFAGELYPFLRGDRLAARVESAQPGRARLLLLADLPEAYLAGLVEAFVGLSGARASCVPVGGGRFDLSYRVAAVDRLVPVVQQAALLRIPLVLAALLAATLGIAMASSSAAPLGWARVAAVLAGALCVQMGANALHDLRHPHPAGPMRLVAPTRRRLLWQARVGYGVASALGLYLAMQAPVVMAFAAVGLGVSAAFGRLRNQGWGPLLAGITYGPLVAAGAYHAFVPLSLRPAPLALHALMALPLGLSAAAILHLDDLADRPLDEAGGSRTLAVRLPRRRQAVLLDALLAAALLATLAIPGAAASRTALALLAGAALFGIGIGALAHRHRDEPALLAPARLAMLAFHACVAAALVLIASGAAP